MLLPACLTGFVLLPRKKSLTVPFVNTSAEEMHPDGDFAPNVINTVVFLLSTAMQVSIFGVNYGGWPHMESLRENKKLL